MLNKFFRLSIYGLMTLGSTSKIKSHYKDTHFLDEEKNILKYWLICRLAGAFVKFYIFIIQLLLGIFIQFLERYPGL